MSEAPRRFWHVTMWTADGIEYRRYVRCPYLVPTEEEHGGKRYRRPLVVGDPDYPDTHAAMSARLGALQEDGVLRKYTLSWVEPERVAAIRHRARRWREVEAILGEAA